MCQFLCATSVSVPSARPLLRFIFLPEQTSATPLNHSSLRNRGKLSLSHRKLHDRTNKKVHATTPSARKATAQPVASTLAVTSDKKPDDLFGSGDTSAAIANPFAEPAGCFSEVTAPPPMSEEVTQTGGVSDRWDAEVSASDVVAVAALPSETVTAPQATMGDGLSDWFSSSAGTIAVPTIPTVEVIADGGKETENAEDKTAAVVAGIAETQDQDEPLPLLAAEQTPIHIVHEPFFWWVCSILLFKGRRPLNDNNKNIYFFEVNGCFGHISLCAFPADLAREILLEEFPHRLSDLLGVVTD